MGTTSTADSAQARALDREPVEQAVNVNKFKINPASAEAEAKRLAGLPARLRTAMSQMEEVLNAQSSRR